MQAQCTTIAVSTATTVIQGCVDFVGKIIVIIGRQKQRAKCWHNRSKFEQNMINQLQQLCLKLTTAYNKDWVSPPKCLFYVATQTEKDRYQDTWLCVSGQESRVAHKYVIYRNC